MLTTFSCYSTKTNGHRTGNYSSSFRNVRKKGPDGYESEDSCYKEGGDDDMYVEKVQAHQPPTRSAKRRIRKVDPQLCTSKQKGKEEVGYSIQVFIFSLSSITRRRHVTSP